MARQIRGRSSFPSEGTVKETKTKVIQEEPAQRIHRVLARTPGFEEIVGQLDSSPLAVPGGEQPGIEEEVRGIEDRLLEKSAAILSDSLRYYEVTEDQKKPPLEWVEELGKDGAQERMRIARYAQKSTRNSPIGTHLARDVFLGIINVRAKRQEAEQPRELNATFTQINISAPPQYPEIVVTDKKRKKR
jgi:hypothetical protein